MGLIRFVRLPINIERFFPAFPSNTYEKYKENKIFIFISFIFQVRSMIEKVG